MKKFWEDLHDCNNDDNVCNACLSHDNCYEKDPIRIKYFLNLDKILNFTFYFEIKHIVVCDLLFYLFIKLCLILTRRNLRDDNSTKVRHFFFSVLI